VLVLASALVFAYADYRIEQRLTWSLFAAVARPSPGGSSNRQHGGTCRGGMVNLFLGLAVINLCLDIVRNLQNQGIIDALVISLSRCWFASFSNANRAAI